MARIAAVNQDSGIAPGRNKGAAVHLEAMREAFSRLGCAVSALDEPDDATLARKLQELVSRHGLDFIYERYSLGGDCAARFAVSRDLPLVLEANAPLAEEAERYRGRKETQDERERDQYLFENATTVLAVSSNVAKYAVARGASPESIQVCPNGIDERLFNLKARDSALQLPAIARDDVVLGFHGRERPWHRLDKLAEACQQLLARDLPIHVLVVGEGEYAALNELPASRMTRLGWQPHREMARYVARFDILPLTHQPDAPCYFSPLKLAEAMGCGAVPVVPRLGDLAATVRHGDNGMLYTAGDMKGFVDCIEQLSLNPDSRIRMGQRAAAFAAGRSWIGIAAQVLDCLGMAVEA